MKQYQAVILTLEKLGGQATLAQLYSEVMKINDCQWNTKTPFASMRRIVQIRPEIFKVRPGLYALRSYKEKLNLTEESDKSKRVEIAEQSHSYYQGLLASIGNFRNFSTFIPNQDKNKKFLNQPLANIRSLDAIPHYSYESFVSRSSTIDVAWFNKRNMPDSFFEVEHSTDMQGALLKFVDLQDFFCNMVVVADQSQKNEFLSKINFTAFDKIKSRVRFLNYETLVKLYEIESYKNNQDFAL